MRVAVTNADGDTHAFRVGRIEGFTNLLTGETASPEEVAAALVVQAEEENPDCTVTIQRLVQNGDGSSTWHDEDKVPDGAVFTPEGNTVANELTVEQTASTEE